MNDTLKHTISLPSGGFDSLKEKEGFIREKIEQDQAVFYSILLAGTDLGDGRVSVVDGSLTVEDLSLNDYGGNASVSFLRDFYAGCKDMDATDQYDAELPFEIVNGNLEFDIPFPKKWNHEWD